MKIFIISISILLFPILTRCQDFKGILGAKADSVIHNQNLLIGDPLIHQKFIDAKQLKNGYMCLVYRVQIDTFSKSSLDMYYFDKNNKCVALKTVFDLTELADQLKNLHDFGYKQIKVNTLYYEHANVKATYYTDLKENVAIFIYSRKEMPDIF